ncbi:MAG: hypothetical protein H8E14_12370 [Candidatus Marinimicrobia bacterium]|nr:hypothetical protein [Candidatus Neomarinimicrobiota bacterium]
MIIILITGLIAILFGILFLFLPNLLEKLNNFGNTIITTDEITIIYRNISGILFIILGILLLFLVYF